MTTNRHPGTLAVLQWFDHDHLPPHLAAVSDVVRSTAMAMVEILDDSPELTAGLRKLLEAKDCFVRQAVLDQRDRDEFGGSGDDEDSGYVRIKGGGHYWTTVPVGANNVCGNCGTDCARFQGDMQTDFDNSDPAGSEADAQNDGPVDDVATEWKGR